VAASSTRNSTNFRLYLLASIFVLWCCGICVRLVYLQIFRYGSFAQRAQHQQQRTEEVSARRGVIYDRQGRELAMSINVDSVFAVPTEMPNAASTISLIARITRQDPRELLARVRAALRHRLQQEGERPLFKSGDLTVDLVRRIVMVRGEEVKLTPREYDLLRLLVMHAGKVLTHKFILREVWGTETDVQYLRIYIRTLRQKIEAEPERPQYIQTEQGVGYRLRASD